MRQNLWVRIEMVTGDSRRGKVMGWDDTHVTILERDGSTRRLQLAAVAKVDRIEPMTFEACLYTS